VGGGEPGAGPQPGGGGHRALPFCDSLVTFVPGGGLDIPGPPGPGHGQFMVAFPERFPRFEPASVPLGGRDPGGGQPQGGGGGGGGVALVPFGFAVPLRGDQDPFGHGWDVPFEGELVCGWSTTGATPNTPPATNSVITPIAVESTATVASARFVVVFIAAPSQGTQRVGG
jgi:hypothetical protein